MRDETEDHDPAVAQPSGGSGARFERRRPVRRGPLGELADHLRDLRLDAGVTVVHIAEALAPPVPQPPVSQQRPLPQAGRRQIMPLARVLALEEGLRLPAWELVQRYLARCGVTDSAQISTWRQRWEAAAKFEEAYRLHRSPLLRFAHRTVEQQGLASGQVDCEGIVHDTFLEAMGAWNTIENPRAWMFTVARRLVLRAAAVGRRSTAGASVADLEQARWSSVASRPSAEDVFHAKEVVTAIANMPDRHRTVLYLRHVEGWSPAEIAELLEVRPQRVYDDTRQGTAKLLDRYRARPVPRPSAWGPRMGPRARRRVLLPGLAVVAATVLVSLTFALITYSLGWWVTPLVVTALIVLGYGGPPARRLLRRGCQWHKRRQSE